MNRFSGLFVALLVLFALALSAAMPAGAEAISIDTNGISSEVLNSKEKHYVGS